MNMRKINTIIAVIITFYSLFNSVISYAAEINDADNIIAEGESIYHGFVSDLDLVDSEEEYMMVQNCINEFFMLKKITMRPRIYIIILISIFTMANYIKSSSINISIMIKK